MILLRTRYLALALLAGLSLAACQARASSPDAGWAHYGGDYGSKRFADLSQITPANVRSLGVACTILLGDDGPFHASPLVVDGVFYLTTSHTTGAFDAANCKKKWVTRYTPEQAYVWASNRGVAYLDNRVYRGTGDGRLIAMDATDGHVVWKIKAVDPTRGEFLSSAPTAWQGLVFIGAAGSDWGVRGHMMAYDAASGKRVWNFVTIPSGNATGADTWKNPRSVATGGGAMWTSYSLDPATGELFVPVGNPAPDWAPGRRPGANLFTDSVLVLNAKSGQLAWWYQLVPNDSHDYDLGAPPALYTDANGVSMVAAGGKDGYVHLVDRRTHALRVKTAVTTLKNDAVQPTTAGVYTCPGPLGGVEWNGPSVDESRRLIFVGSNDECGTFKLGGVKDVPGVSYNGGTVSPGSTPASGWLVALDATTGAVHWKHHLGPVVAGVTSTASGVVFAGDANGRLYAFASNGGAQLASWTLPGQIAGGIDTYTVGGTQYLAVPNGSVSRFFGGFGSPRMTVYALGATKNAVVDVRPKGPKIAQSGEQIYAANCIGCHSAGGAGGAGGPSLKGEATRKNLAQATAWIKNPAPPMPKLYPTLLTERDVAAVAAYVETLK
jgi:alcohol dehydrogenase (cytochrome c)